MGKRKHPASGESASGSGSDSSSAEDSPKETKPKIKSSPPSKTYDDDSSSSSDEGDEEWGKKTKSKKKTKVSSSKKAKREDDEKEEGEVDDDEDEEEAAIRNLNNLGADEELDSDDDMYMEEFNDGYDENLMGDEEDQRRLAQMTEKEREQELFNRSEKREVLRTRFEIEKKLRAQKRADRERQQRKNQLSKDNKDALFTETSNRSTERRRDLEAKNNKKDALKVMKEIREKKKLKQQKLQTADVYSSSSSDSDDEDRKGGRSSSSSSSSSSSDSDSDGEGKKKKKRGRRGGSDDDHSDDEGKDDNYEFTIDECNAIRISRSDCWKWCHSRIFNSTILNAFVKLGVGPKVTLDGTVVNTYRVAQVIEVEDGNKVYDLPGMDPLKDKTKTNKIVKLKHGKEERGFRLEFISNGPITQDEFDYWKKVMEKDNLELPTRSMVEGKKRDILFAKNYRLTDEEIAYILKQKGKFNSTPKNYAMKKTQLMKEKEDAEQLGNEEEVARLQKELDALEERAKELDKQRTNSIAAISYINERNRMRNIKDAEKAILEESKREAESKTDDPFRRRKCAPQLMTTKFIKKEPGSPSSNANGVPVNDVKPPATLNANNGSNIQGSVVSIKAEPGTEDQKPILNPLPIKVAPPSPNPDDRRTGDDLFNAHDFEIQIDFDIGGSGSHSLPHTPAMASLTSNVTGLSVADNASTKPITNRRSLNLEEYKKKKGLI